LLSAARQPQGDGASLSEILDKLSAQASHAWSLKGEAVILVSK